MDSKFNSWIFNIRERFEQDTYRVFYRYTQLIQFKSNTIPRRIFLLRCRKNKTTPRFILDKMVILNSLYEQRHSYEYEINKMKNEFCQKILNMEIALCYKHIKNINKQLSECENDMTTRTSINFATTFMKYQDRRLAKLIKRKGRTLNNKFMRLFQKQHPTPDFIYDENCCVNLKRR